MFCDAKLMLHYNNIFEYLISLLELDIDVSNKGDVVVENVESRGIDVNCDKGCCRLNNVKVII